MSQVRVRKNTDASRYEAYDAETLAGVAAYIPAQGMVVFTHTEVDPTYEGQGVGSALARAGLDDVREQGLQVMPLCPFIHAWIGRHREYLDLVFNAPPSNVTD